MCDYIRSFAFIFDDEIIIVLETLRTLIEVLFVKLTI